MDLAGPKLRTGAMEPGPAVIRIRPRRDVFGRVIAPARIWLSPTPLTPPTPADASLLLPADWLARLRVGEEVRFVDARNAVRDLKIVDVSELGCWAEATETAYIVSGTMLRCDQKGAKDKKVVARVGELPRNRNGILLQQGDHLILTRSPIPGRPATIDGGGRILTPAMISCTIPGVFDDVGTGEAIWLDDGKIGGIVERIEADQVRVRITRVRPGGVHLYADKGINLPDSALRLRGLTDDDVECLPFIAEHADIIGLSFANSVEDVESLQKKLIRQGGRSCCD